MAFYRQRDLKAFTQEVTTEGVAIGGGFIAGGAIGAFVESKLAQYDPLTSTLGQKLWGWAANNGGKFALYFLAKHYEPGSMFAREATKALAGSVVYDTVIRLANGGSPPPSVTVGGYRILGDQNNPNMQKLVQENSILRTELNKALQKLAGVPVQGLDRRFADPGYNVSPNFNPDSSRDYRYASTDKYDEQQRGAGGIGIPDARARPYSYSMPVTPDVAERQRYYGHMPQAMPYGAMPYEQDSPKTARQRRYGFAAEPPANNVFEMFGMW